MSNVASNVFCCWSYHHHATDVDGDSTPLRSLSPNCSMDSPTYCTVAGMVPACSVEWLPLLRATTRTLAGMTPGCKKCTKGSNG